MPPFFHRFLQAFPYLRWNTPASRIMFRALISAFLPASSDFYQKPDSAESPGVRDRPADPADSCDRQLVGVLYPPPALSGGVMPEENSKNQSADSVSDALISDNDMNWLSQKKHIIFDVNKKAAALISSKADPMTCSNHSERSGTASASKTTTEPTESSSNSKITATHTVSADSSLPDKAHASSDNSITLRVTCRFLSFLPGGSE